LYLRWPLFSMRHRWTDSFNLSFSFEWGIGVHRVDKSYVLMLSFNINKVWSHKMGHTMKSILCGVYSDTNTESMTVSKLLETERSKQCVESTTDSPLDCMYSKRSLEFFRIHIWFTLPIEYLVCRFFVPFVLILLCRVSEFDNFVITLI
jgi:hypothetical protein